MIRKAIIVVLTLALVATAVAFVLTFEFFLGYADDTCEVFLLDGMLGIAFGNGMDMNGCLPPEIPALLIRPLRLPPQ